MPLLDITNPKVISFLLENYEKESRLRMKWVNRHEEQIQKAAKFRGEVKNYNLDDVNRSVMVAAMATVTRDHVVSARHRMTAPVKDYLRVKVGTAKEVEAPMLPVSNGEQDLLYQSRKEYLKVRSKKGPEEKFYFAQSGNWGYGWKLGESELKLQGPAHGRVCHMMHILNGRVGPQPDPDYYASPDNSNNFCS